MPKLLDRITNNTQLAFFPACGVTVSQVTARLQQGQSLDQVASAEGLSTIDMIAALAYLGLGSEQTPLLELVQQRPRFPHLATVLSEPSLAQLVPGAPSGARLSLVAGLLQIHDFWDSSHHAAQQADDLHEPSDSAFWHGIAHRREPDHGNAAYWFRRLGPHPIDPLLTQDAQRILNDAKAPVPGSERLIRNGRWDPFAFIDICRTVRPGSDAAKVARQLQRAEIALLIDHSASALGLD